VASLRRWLLGKDRLDGEPCGVVEVVPLHEVVATAFAERFQIVYQMHVRSLRTSLFNCRRLLPGGAETLTRAEEFRAKAVECERLADEAI
jgi:hypothetical protein